MKTLIFALALLSVPFVASARMMSGWSYQDMLDKADLVVIAQPTENKQTSEATVLVGIHPDVHVVGVETAFKVSTTLKGDKEMKALVLHHYQLADPGKRMFDGPTLAVFDPKESRCFLLFLVREWDGRYAPVTGQTDPALFSVLGLAGIAQ